nr:phage major capsid protein [Pseudomonadota bacterium]
MDMSEVTLAIDALKKASADRIAILETKNAEVLTQNRELTERVQTLEQRPAPGGPHGGAPTRPEGPADLLIKSPQLAAFRAGETRSVRIPVKSFHMETKAVTMVSTMAGGAPFRAPVVTTDLPLRVSVRSLIPSRPTVAGSIEYVRTTRSGLAAVQVAEGDVKAQIDLQPVLIHQPVVTVAGWTNVSKQMMDDDVSLREVAGATLLESLTWAEDLELLKGTVGFFSVATAYSRGISGDTAIDQLRKAITQLQLVHGIADGIVISPAGLEELELKKDSLGDYILELEVDTLNRTNLW